MAEGNGKSKLVGKELNGTVVWFNEEKGHGFIRPEKFTEEHQMDVFVHYTGIDSSARRKNLKADQRVVFVVIADERHEGEVKAANVRVTG